MFLRQTIDLTADTPFEAGDTVLFRFRLASDQQVTGWGWAIDNVVVSTDYTAVGDLPQAMALEQNYPNPFNPKTTIAFTLDRSAPVKLQVFDVAGRLVRTLVDEDLNAGTHTRTWQGRDDQGRQVASGVYLARFDHPKGVESRSMVLVK